MTGTKHVTIEIPAGGKESAKEVLDYRVGPACNWHFFQGPENWRGGRKTYIVLWGEYLEADTLRRLGNACHELEMERSDMAMYDAAKDADRMEGAFIRAESEVSS